MAYRFKDTDLGKKVVYVPPYARNNRSERQEGILQSFDNMAQIALVAYIDEDGEYSAQTRYEDLVLSD